MHPHVLAVERHVSTGVPIYDTLKQYYALTDVGSAAQYFGLPEAASLQHVPAADVPMPWEHWTQEETARLEERGFHMDAAQYGRQFDGVVGRSAYGPATDEFVEFEAERLGFVLRACRESRSAVDRIFSLINVVRLRCRKSDVFVVQNGQHRAAVFAALGLETMRCRIMETVEVGHYDLWPNVQRKLFTPSQALSIWCRMHSGLPPAWSDSWTAYVRQHLAMACSENNEGNA